MLKLSNLKLTQTKIILLVSLYFVSFYNFTFFSKTLNVYPLSFEHAYSLFTLTAILYLVINLVLSLLRFRYFFKGFLIFFLFLAMAAAYVMDSYAVVIDDTMLVNVLSTDAKETLDLLTPRLGIYLVILFLLPAFLIYKVKIEDLAFKDEVWSRLKTVGISLILILVLLFSAGKFYASFFRTQKALRYYTNPTYFIYSMGRLATKSIKSPNKKFILVGRDAKFRKNNSGRKLLIFVLGETARRDRFSLNGHNKKTNPLLEKENVISFNNVTSCGTSTASSVPCIFSNLGRANFSIEEAKYRENLLDVLGHTKEVDILWRDNNSSSKGVADRMKFEDYKSSALNTMCDLVECRDVGLLVGLQAHIDQVTEENIVIVLHQMGNHGPAYFKRYPKEFEVFKPVCLTSELSKCTNEQIENTYDNAILYTDFFLSKVIDLLKVNSNKFDTSMIYMSDHGESLGENGVYLHGMPYIMAPRAQIEVPLIMWFGENLSTSMDLVGLKNSINESFSHDNFFHTVLGLMNIETTDYDPKLDILNGKFRGPGGVVVKGP